MTVMDHGDVEQTSYRARDAWIALQDGCEETTGYDEYSWSEPISGKLGPWWRDPADLLEAFEACGGDPVGTANTPAEGGPGVDRP